MKNRIPGNLRYYALIAIAGILFVSCGSPKKLQYFSDLPDEGVVNLPPIKMEERIIQPNDEILIEFGARDPQAAAPFNSISGTSPVVAGAIDITATPTTGGGAAPNRGYKVNSLGQIQLPILGYIRVQGMTMEKLKDSLLNMVAPYLKDPMVVTNFANYNFTVLGEVLRPGGYNLPLERTTIFDALGAAGDLTPNGKRLNVSIYRDYNGKRTIQRLDMTKKDFLNNPSVFQIRHNDVVYVQMNRSRQATEDARLLTMFTSFAVSIVSLILTLTN